jgi:hypothetical protein
MHPQHFDHSQLLVDTHGFAVQPLVPRKKCINVDCCATIRSDSIFHDCSACYARTHGLVRCRLTPGCLNFTPKHMIACMQCHFENS